MNDFQRGSEWRRWDLHIHTPFTRKNDCFTGCTDSSKQIDDKTSEKWDNFFRSTLDYIGNLNDPLKSIRRLMASW